MKCQLSVDGLEMTFALNRLGYFLLMNLLMDRFSASPSARIVAVSSVAHEHGRIEFDNLQGERHYERVAAYAQSNLANLLFTHENARQPERTHVTANAATPGEVATNLGIINGWLRTKLRNLLRQDMVTPREGARTVVYLAASPDVEGITGRNYYREKETSSSRTSRDPSLAKRLWEVSEGLTGIAG